MPVVGSKVEESAVAELVRVPLASASTVAITREVRVPPAGMASYAQVTSCPLTEQPPLADTGLRPAGKVSVTVTETAAEGPLLTAVRKNTAV